MKPFTFRCGKARGYFAQQKKRGAEAAALSFQERRARLATRKLSNVQLFAR
jgi:hypothetical protein